MVDALESCDPRKLVIGKGRTQMLTSYNCYTMEWYANLTFSAAFRLLALRVTEFTHNTSDVAVTLE